MIIQIQNVVHSCSRYNIVRVLNSFFSFKNIALPVTNPIQSVWSTPFLVNIII